MTAERAVDIVTDGDHDIVMTRSFAAPRTHVFEALTNPELVRQWLGPATWEMVVCEIDLRVDGRWRYVLRGPAGEQMGMGGVYREIRAPVRIVSTEIFDQDWTSGGTLNTVALTELDGMTTVTTTVHYSSPDARAAALATGMAEGIKESYGRLDDVLDALADVG